MAIPEPGVTSRCAPIPRRASSRACPLIPVPGTAQLAQHGAAHAGPAPGEQRQEIQGQEQRAAAAQPGAGEERLRPHPRKSPRGAAVPGVPRALRSTQLPAASPGTPGAGQGEGRDMGWGGMRDEDGMGMDPPAWAEQGSPRGAGAAGRDRGPGRRSRAGVKPFPWEKGPWEGRLHMAGGAMEPWDAGPRFLRQSVSRRVVASWDTASSPKGFPACLHQFLVRDATFPTLSDCSLRNSPRWHSQDSAPSSQHLGFYL